MTNEEPSDLDWVQLRREMGTVQHGETTGQKFSRKFSENPFVPIGMYCLMKYVAKKHLQYIEEASQILSICTI